MADDPRNIDFDRIWRVAGACGLPGLEAGQSHGFPVLKAGGKFLAGCKIAGSPAFHCPQEEKSLLMEALPHLWFETDHYRGWPAVLLRLDAASDGDIAEGVIRAWRANAPAKLKKAYAAR